MILIRPVQLDDLSALHELALQSGIGITTFPKDKALLKKRIEWACHSFEKKTAPISNEYYLFVAEDPNSKRIIGTSAIESGIGFEAPFYSFKVSTIAQQCEALTIHHEYQLLNLVNDFQGKSEICTLYLEPTFRINGNGLLLSRARFLFMAQEKQRFSSIIIADIRGVSDNQGNSPFWDNIGQHFFKIPFAEADRLTLTSNKQFIADLMPRSPIYVNLLKKDVQAVIGVPHPESAAAFNILLREGFFYHEYVDIFDAGPTIEAHLDQISTVKTSRIVTVHKIEPITSKQRFLIATISPQFRATQSVLWLDECQTHCVIPPATASLLKVKIGESVSIAPFQLPPYEGVAG